MELNGGRQCRITGEKIKHPFLGDGFSSKDWFRLRARWMLSVGCSMFDVFPGAAGRNFLYPSGRRRRLGEQPYKYMPPVTYFLFSRPIDLRKITK
jgi:hypothetical protein